MSVLWRSTRCGLDRLVKSPCGVKRVCTCCHLPGKPWSQNNGIETFGWMCNRADPEACAHTWYSLHVTFEAAARDAAAGIVAPPPAPGSKPLSLDARRRRRRMSAARSPRTVK